MEDEEKVVQSTQELTHLQEPKLMMSQNGGMPSMLPIEEKKEKENGLQETPKILRGMGLSPMMKAALKIGNRKGSIEETLFSIESS